METKTQSESESELPVDAKMSILDTRQSQKSPGSRSGSDSGSDSGSKRRPPGFNNQPTQSHQGSTRTRKYRNKKILCCNCGKPGHVYRKCFEPITSLGIICAYSQRNIDPSLSEHKKVPVTKTPISNNAIPRSETLKYVFIRRKDSLSFAEIARARYKVNDEEYIRKMLVRMTRGEMEFLKTVKTADEIWYRLWTSKKNSKSRQSEYYRAKKKLQTLIDGVKTPKGCFSFSSLLDEIAPRWEEPEWGFPKGRRVPKESDLDCALREFQEETDIARENIHVLPIKPVEETFIGSNNVKYKHIYFLAYCEEEIQLQVNPKNKHQKAEVSAISWLPAHDLIEKIRGNNQERKKIVVHVTNYFHSILGPVGPLSSTPQSTLSAKDVKAGNDKNKKESEV